MWRTAVVTVLRFGAVYAVTGVFGLGYLAWHRFRVRRRKSLDRDTCLAGERADFAAVDESPAPDAPV